MTGFPRPYPRLAPHHRRHTRCNSGSCMSLVKQFLTTLVLLLVLAFASAYGISTQAARHTLQDQLTQKNADNAKALALALSQLRKDAAAQDLLLSAQFETGHYALLRLTAADGTVTLEKRYEGPTTEVPAWFIRAVGIEVPPGRGTVQDGWQPHATLQVESRLDTGYALLWASARATALWFAAALAVVLALAGGVVHYIARPLRRLVEQALALAQRRFTTVPVPPVRELGAMARAMNQAVQALQALFTQETQQIEALNRRLNTDALTGVALRERFLGDVRDALTNDQRPAQGWLVLVHVVNLGGWTLTEGRSTVDAALQRLAAHLQGLAERSGMQGATVGRLNGSDFALLVPGDWPDSEGAAQRLHESAAVLLRQSAHQGFFTRSALVQVADAGAQADLSGGMGLSALNTADASGGSVTSAAHATGSAGSGASVRVGVAAYRRGEGVGQVLARGDEAVSHAQVTGTWAVVLADQGVRPSLSLGLQGWRQLITGALRAPGGFALQTYPLRRLTDREVIHQEAFLRLDVAAARRMGGNSLAVAGLDALQGLLPGGDFIPEAARLKMGAEVDLRSIELACASLRSVLNATPSAVPNATPIALNLSGDSLGSVEFRLGLRRLLSRQPQLASLLWLETPEHEVLRQPQAFEELAHTLHNLGVGVGIDFFGLNLERTLRLESLGLAYVKLHPALLENLSQRTSQQEVIQRLAATVRHVGVAVYAQGVRTPADAELLARLGVDGVTGPGVA